MEKARNSSAWTDAGYDLFAEEGLEGLQVERLARILQLNKSGFYHYFGDLEVYLEELLKLHQHHVHLYLDRVREIKTIDPEYLLVLIEFKVPTLFQMQLDRIKDNPSIRKVSDWVDRNEDIVMKQVWCQYLGVEGNTDLAMRYFNMFRSMFYERITYKNYALPFVTGLFAEAKDVMNQLSNQKAVDTNDFLH